MERLVSGTAFRLAFVGATLGTVALFKPDVVVPFVPDVPYPKQTYSEQCPRVLTNDPWDDLLSGDGDSNCAIVPDDMAPVYGELVANANRETVDLARQGFFGLAISMVVAGAIVRISENKRED